MKVFVSKSDIDGERITVSDEDLHHLEKVLRAKNGETIIACDGEFDYRCEFEDKALVIKDRLRCESENKTHITIFQGVPKQNKMETIIQMASELGVDRIIPIKTEHCIADLPNEKKLERWRKIASESAKQCRRDRVLSVENGVSFDEALIKAKELDFSFILYEHEKDNKLKNLELPDKIGVFIGSEGGFSAKEIARANIESITLGKRILRTQTVAAVITAIILAQKGEI